MLIKILNENINRTIYSNHEYSHLFDPIPTTGVKHSPKDL